MNPILFITGNKTLCADAKNSTAVLDLCLRCGVTYSDFVCATDGSVRFCVSSSAAKRLLRLCEREGIALRVLHSGGLPLFLWRYRKRAGMFLGILLSFCLLLLSERFVWDVRVTGNTQMRAEEVVEELRACGFGVGSYIPSVHTEQLETRVLIASDRISWIAIRINGTVAEVQVIEHTPTPPDEDIKRPANLIAAMDGQIELIELYRGDAVVKIGQAVRRGELLASGLYESQTVGVRYTRAAGKILARTEHEFLIEIPLSYEQKVYEEEKYGEFVLKFFDFSLKFFKNSRNREGICDIIKEEQTFCLPNGAMLPVQVSYERVRPYRLQTVMRTPEEALELAYGELDAQIAEFSDGAELLGKQISTTLTETSLVLHCTVTCIEDIAVQQEFEISE